MNEKSRLLKRYIFIVSMAVLMIEGALQASAAGLVINEVMSNVRGSDSGLGTPGDRNEFIEIFNASDDTIDLSLYRVSDMDAVDDIIAWTDTLLLDPDAVYGATHLPPGEYSVILDPEYIEIGDGNYLQPYDFPPKTLIVTVGNTTIGDGLSTKDPIILLDASEDTVSSYGTPGNTVDNIPYDPGDGISVERISPFYPDNELYWVSSQESSGSTPGAANSCYSQAELILPSYGFNIEPEKIVSGETVTLSVLVQNQTEDTVKGVSIDFFVDTDWDSILSSNEEIATLYKDDPIPPYGCTLRVEVEWKPASIGNKRVGVKLSGDEKAETFKMLKVGDIVGEIIITEIMYAPLRGGEWLELYNRAPFPIDLFGWKMKVGVQDAITISVKHTVLPQNEYLVIVEDKTLFQTKWGNVPSTIVEPEKWTSLGNSGDTILIEDNSFFIFEEIFYRDGSEQGVSIERINIDIKSNLNWNWGNSCDYSGATPGRKNSIYASSSHSKTVLSVNPNPFSPDGDGYQERTVISYELPFNKAKVNLSLYTRTGIRKHNFLKQKDSGRNGEFIWDGRDSGGKKMPVGLYIVYLEAVDKETNKKIIQKTAVVIAGRR
ncbi:MAG: lamin tail domain-containing protein [Candidatus Cloacimonadota bacterium]|nr:MAG: lamin tail domain-containing protein [Candidatus Cloacimonadota bacterium]